MVAWRVVPKVAYLAVLMVAWWVVQKVERLGWQMAVLKADQRAEKSVDWWAGMMVVMLVAKMADL